MRRISVKRMIALLIVAGIPALLMIWYRAHQTTTFASVELIAYPLVFGSLGIAVIYLLKRLFLGEPISGLNIGEGSLTKDAIWGAALTGVYFVLFFLARYLLSDLLTFRPNLELLGLMLDMRESPLLVLLWFGPVLWIGIALFEELMRAFVLTELWSFSQSRLWVAVAILLSAVLIGLTHWSQGPYGIVTIAMKSVVVGAFYLRYRRLLPLVFAHVLYDGLQVGVLLLTYPNP